MPWLILGVCVLQVCLVAYIIYKLRNLINDINVKVSEIKFKFSYYDERGFLRAETINSKIDFLSGYLLAQQALNEVDKGLDKIDAAAKPKPTQKTTTKAAPKKTVKGGKV
jgi:hypothetical protein